MTKKKRVASSKSASQKSTAGLSLTPTAKETLDRMAKKMGLSRSALVEQIVGGEIAIAMSSAKTTIALDFSARETGENLKGTPQPPEIEVLPSQTVPQEVSASDPNQPSEAEIQVLQEQLEEAQQQVQLKDDRIADLQTQYNEQNTSLQERDRNIQVLEAQCREKDEQVAELEEKLNGQKALARSEGAIARSLQEQCQERDERISELQAQLLAQQSLSDSQAESIQALTQQLEQEDRAIAQLQAKLDDRTQHFRSLQEQCQERDRYIQTLQEELQAALDQVESYRRELEQKSEQQAREIEALQKQLAQLQTLARLGERQLNRWSSRTFSR